MIITHTIERWVGRRLGNIEHERRVAKIALALFDLSADRHGLEPRHRRLLELGCLVHDVGRTVDREDHPAEGARLLLSDDRLPLDNQQRRALAFLTRHHRGRVPDRGCERHLARRDDRRAMRAMLAFLRAADAMDARSGTPPRLNFSLRGRKLRVTVQPQADPAAFYCRRKKLRMLESLLDCRLEIRLTVTPRARLVA